MQFIDTDRGQSSLETRSNNCVKNGIFSRFHRRKTMGKISQYRSNLPMVHIHNLHLLRSWCRTRWKLSRIPTALSDMLTTEKTTEITQIYWIESMISLIVQYASKKMYRSNSNRTSPFRNVNVWKLTMVSKRQETHVLFCHLNFQGSMHNIICWYCYMWLVRSRFSWHGVKYLCHISFLCIVSIVSLIKRIVANVCHIWR